MVSDPVLIKDLFTTNTDLIARAGVLGEMFGPGSTFSLDGTEHRALRAQLVDEVVHPSVLEQAAHRWAVRPKRPLDRPLARRAITTSEGAAPRRRARGALGAGTTGLSRSVVGRVDRELSSVDLAPVEEPDGLGRLRLARERHEREAPRAPGRSIGREEGVHRRGVDPEEQVGVSGPVQAPLLRIEGALEAVVKTAHLLTGRNGPSSVPEKNPTSS